MTERSRNIATVLAFLAAIVLPTAMLASAYALDRGISSCFGDWSDGQQSAYKWLLVASPLVAAAFAFVAIAIAMTGTWARWLSATGVGFTYFAVVGVAALVVGYNGGGCAG